MISSRYHGRGRNAGYPAFLPRPLMSCKFQRIERPLSGKADIGRIKTVILLDCGEPRVLADSGGSVFVRCIEFDAT